MKSNIPSPVRPMAAAAFTLVEIIIVIIIIVMLLVLMTPPLLGVLEGNRLTQSGQTLLFRISAAKQMALTENRPVELRFFRYADDNGVKGFHAAQLFFIDEAANEAETIETPLYLSSGVTISDSSISPLLGASGEGASGEAMPADREPFKSMSAEYRKIVFYPNGSTSINVPLRDAYLTLCSTRTLVTDAAVPPTNYYTIQVDPINGSTKSYRPD